jgi:hypothetical protein
MPLMPNADSVLLAGSQRQRHVRALNIASFVTAVIGAAFVWCFSSTLDGGIEPWDSGSDYYFLGIASTSAISGMLAGRGLWIPLLGTYVGQVIYCLLFYRGSGPVVLPIAISAGIFGFMPSLVGSVAGAIVHEMYCVVKEIGKKPKTEEKRTDSDRHNP